MRHTYLIAAACLLMTPLAGQACDLDTGERQQRVYLSWNNERLQHWIVEDGSIHSVELPNGFEVGIRIEDAMGEMLERHKDLAYLYETVRITLYDMSETPPRKLTHTYGGANSIQGYGGNGGADRVGELGTPGIRMNLLKPVCVKRDAIAMAD